MKSSQLIRKLTSVSARQLAEPYGGVSQAAISKAVQRAEPRPDEQRRDPMTPVGYIETIEHGAESRDSYEKCIGFGRGAGSVRRCSVIGWGKPTLMASDLLALLHPDLHKKALVHRTENVYLQINVWARGEDVIGVVTAVKDRYRVLYRAPT